MSIEAQTEGTLFAALAERRKLAREGLIAAIVFAVCMATLATVIWFW